MIKQVRPRKIKRRLQNMEPRFSFRGFLILGINFSGSTCLPGDDRCAEISYIKGGGKC